MNKTGLLQIINAQIAAIKSITPRVFRADRWGVCGGCRDAKGHCRASALGKRGQTIFRIMVVWPRFPDPGFPTALIFDEYDAGRPDVMLEPQGKARARVLLTCAPFSAIRKGFQRSLSRGG